MTRPGSPTQLGEAVAKALVPWFSQHARPLSWRRHRDPYAIWVSEIMLQQTRVETVERYFDRFMQRFPTVEALAQAREDEVLALWSGLGYYRRARLLHRGAKFVCAELGGQLPRDAAGLRAIPGIGRYTAGAIGSIAFDEPSPLVDGNVARVFSRLCAIEDPKQQGADAAGHWQRAAEVLEHGSPHVLAQAMMEFGATVCTPKQPRCDGCPLAHRCQAKATGQVSAIPAVRKKAAVLEVHWGALAVISRRRLLLVKRPADGLLAGLWCLPLAPAGPRGLHDLPAFDPMPAFEATTASVRHVFSHRVWHLAVHEARVARRPALPQAPRSGAVWIAPGERPEGGVPSVTDKLLACLAY